MISQCGIFKFGPNLHANLFEIQFFKASVCKHCQFIQLCWNDWIFCLYTAKDLPIFCLCTTKQLNYLSKYCNSVVVEQKSVQNLGKISEKSEKNLKILSFSVKSGKNWEKTCKKLGKLGKIGNKSGEYWEISEKYQGENIYSCCNNKICTKLEFVPNFRQKIWNSF